MPKRPTAPRFVSRLVIDAIHFDTVSEHGGMRGLRDEVALESAIARPKQLAAYGPGADLAALCASLGHGIARNHPFNDGNKRVAFVAMAVMAELNGAELDASETDVVTVMLDLAAGAMSEDDLAEWLRSHLT